ncbi:MAG: hypothetical protein HXX15_19505 [Rhodopseudomonas sp.]|uniref:hypothetical protein n=1 Tax=Rhodopseudomonas sp. TaxID=1078 RepID=UPI0018000454|nr:hypothetical protein [Rhodopseudomonas sp.]NVN88272.1 hypothetical protein [Rhodopseudomonas sp.]
MHSEQHRRLGEEQLAALLQDSLAVGYRTGARQIKAVERVVVDTLLLRWFERLLRDLLQMLCCVVRIQ